MDERRPQLSPAKREQILEGARAVFQSHGYERATVDAIAARAGVSKATLYNHFRSKEALFLFTLGAETQAVQEKFLSLLETPSGEIEADLQQIGEHLVRKVSEPAHVRRYRIIAAEAERFPELGRAFYDCTIRTGEERMAAFLARAAEEGQLDVDDPEAAAADFFALCLGNLGPRLHLGVVEPEKLQVERKVKRAVRSFLRAYRPSARIRWEGPYLATSYEAGKGISIRIGERCGALEEELERRGCTEWAYITAWNPRSVPLSEEVNRDAQARLEKELEARGIGFLPGASRPDDASPPEPSVLAFLPRDEAAELGRAFCQNAIVVGRLGSPAELLWLE